MKNKNIYLKRRQMALTVIFGILFLISTTAFYFVHTSKAQELKSIKIGVIDEKLELSEIYYQEKVAKQDNGVYKIKLPSVQNGFIVESYYLL